MRTAVAVRVCVEAAQPAETANVNATPSASACHRLRATNFNPLTPLCRVVGFSATRLASADSRAIRNNRGEARGVRTDGALLSRKYTHDRHGSGRMTVPGAQATIQPCQREAEAVHRSQHGAGSRS